MTPSLRVRQVALATLVAAAYFVAAKLGLSLASVNASATAVWPPTGVAIAATLILGYVALPGVLVGAFFANLTTSGVIATSAGIAAGNTLEALVAVLLVRRFAGGRHAFDQPRNIFVFALITTLVATPISATIGVGTLLAGGLATVDLAGPIWLTWWLGDAAGALVFAPSILLWANRPRPGWSGPHAIEVGLVFLAALGVSAIIFAISDSRLPLAFAALPLVIYAAFRFGPREVATLVLALCAITIVGTLRGTGPFAVGNPNQALLLVQSFVAVVTLVSLPVAALVEENRRAGERLSRAVEERTRDLTDAQRIARLASWTYDAGRDELVASDELPRLYGLDRSSFPSRYQDVVALTHPEDRALADEAVTRALREGTGFEFDYRVTRPDGESRTLHAHGEVRMSPEGNPIASGTTQDVTEMRASEMRLRAFLEAAPDAIVVTDAEGRMTYVNRQAERIFGYAREEMLGQPVEMLIPAGAREAHPRHRTGYFANPHARPMGADLDLRARRKDGVEFPVEISLSPIRTPEGLRVMSAIRDTTEKRRTERVEREQFVTKKLVRRMLRHEGITGGSPTLRRDLGRQMADEAGGTKIQEFIEAFKAMGLGNVALESQEGDRYVVRGSDLLEVTPGFHATTCHLTLGFLEGAVKRITGRQALGAETECQSQGRARCTFVVVARAKQ